MAVIWERRTGGHLYQVRKAGKSLRLYTDGIFHTQYRPDRVLGGGYWDLLSLPGLMVPEGKIRRVLLLGVGGGAAIHSLQALLKPAVMIGVELNPVHVKIMKRFFGLGRGPGGRQAKGLRLEVMDARDFIRHYRGPKFDLIVEDLYIERNEGAVRAVVMDKAWMAALRRCLAADGMLVCNYPDRREFRQSLGLAKWQGIYAMTLPAYENVVGVYVRRRELMMDIPAALRRCARSDERVPAKAPRFQVAPVRQT